MTQTPAVRIMSFGYLHHGPPAAHVVVDVRDWFRNPADDPSMIEMTGLDRKVYLHVLDTHGVTDFATRLYSAVGSLVGLDTRTVTLAIGCAGGRHRSVAIAEYVTALLRSSGHEVALTHRDVTRPVVRR